MRRIDVLEALAASQGRAWREGHFIGQESFISAPAIDAIARAASIDAGTRVLDLCSGSAGPGRYLARRHGCAVTAVDCDASALEVADTHGGLAALVHADVPPIPLDGPFDVVILLETLLAFEDKAPLLAEVARVLVPGGRFATSFEEGAPLDDEDRRAMPNGHTVWPIPLDTLRALLAQQGFEIGFIADDTALHAEAAARLSAAFNEVRPRLAASLGDDFVDDLIRSHALWADWMRTGRVRKFSLVAQHTRPLVADADGRACEDADPQGPPRPAP